MHLYDLYGPLYLCNLITVGASSATNLDLKLLILEPADDRRYNLHIVDLNTDMCAPGP